MAKKTKKSQERTVPNGIMMLSAPGYGTSRIAPIEGRFIHIDYNPQPSIKK